MAILRIGHRPWWFAVPLVGRLAPVEREERSLATDPGLKMKVSSRPIGAWDWLKRLSMWNTVSRILGGKDSAGDHLVVDTGTRLVDIKGDHLNLSGIKQGDSVEFNLDPGVDPGGASYVKGEVVMVQDAPDPEGKPEPAPGTFSTRFGKLDRPIDVTDPASDLVVRRAELFKAFRESRINQDELASLWNLLRNQALDAIVNGTWTYFEKQDLTQRLMEMQAFTEDEAKEAGIAMASAGSVYA